MGWKLLYHIYVIEIAFIRALYITQVWLSFSSQTIFCFYNIFTSFYNYFVISCSIDKAYTHSYYVI